MLIRVLTLLFFTSQVWSAGISIDQVVYTDADEWERLDIDPSIIKSYKFKTIDYVGDRPEVLGENDVFGIDALYKSGQQLNKISLSQEGVVTTASYPQIENNFTDYIGINGVPFILDEVSDTVYSWDQELEYWQDLSVLLGLPEGEYTDILSINNNLVVSIDDAQNKGLWYIGAPSYQLTSTLFNEESRIIYSPNGYMQLYIEDDGQYGVHWIGLEKESDRLPVDIADYFYWGSGNSSSGTLSIFLGEQGPYFLWSDADGHRQVLPPMETTRILACYSESYPNLFCAFVTDNREIVLYEVENGQFREDTKLGLLKDFDESYITSVLAIGDKRYVSIATRYGDILTRYSLSVIGSEEPFLLADIDITYGSDNDIFRMFKSKKTSESDFYYVGITSSNIIVNKITHEGSAVFVENSPESDEPAILPRVDVDVSAEEIEEVEEEVEEEKEIPYKDFSGSFSFYILFVMLLTLSMRKPRLI